MKRVSRRPRRRRLLVPALTLIFLSLLVGGLGARSVFDAHMQAVTGRTDTPLLSCLYCHRDVEAPQVGPPAGGSRFVSPADLALSPDGERLFVAAQGSARLIEVALESGAVTRSVVLGDGPVDLALSHDGRLLAVTCTDSDQVSLVDVERLAVVRTLATGPEPSAAVFDVGDEHLFVSESWSGDVVGIDLTGGAGSSRLSAGSDPQALALGPRGAYLAVANRRVRPCAADEVASAELTLIDPARGRVRERRALTSAHLSEDVALTPDGAWALAPLVHFRNLLPITQVARGAVMTSALALIETRPGGLTAQFPLDELNACFADPAGVAVTPDGRTAFVAHRGARVVTAVDLAAMQRLARAASPARLAALPDDLALAQGYVLARIPTRAAPGAMSMHPDGSRLFVAERLADSVAVIDVAGLAVIGRIDLGSGIAETAERRGERVFHDASVTFQGQFSCSSCHPDGHTDGLVWDFEIDGVGQNLLETRSLRGIRDTAPFKWNGKNPDLATQCGPRFARVLTRSDPIPAADLADLVAFIESIPLRSRRAPPEDAAARERGRVLFERTRTTGGTTIAKAQRCNTCHRPPLFTDRLKREVGTGAAFDTPHLFDLVTSAPYLHDGRALTLEEIWTVHSPRDEHGVTSDMSKVELNDLMAFLRSL